jgi:ribosomal protein S18 acetylase RimI-like enzyme
MDDLRFPVLDRALAVASLHALHDLAADMEWMAWTDENYLHELPDKWAFSRLAVLPDGTVAGYALCSRKGTRLWLHRLVVGQAFRGRAIGRALMGELKALARAEGLAGTSLKTPVRNDGARRFYEGQGFTESALANDHITMDLNLDVTVSIHQPNFIPWLGYFYKIVSSDVFILLDDAEYTSGSYLNRTQILIQGKPAWMTIPVIKQTAAIRRVQQADARWAEKHIKTIEANYRKTPFYDTYSGAIADVIRSQAGASLAKLNIALIHLVCGWLGIRTRMVKSSSFGLSETSDDRLIRLVQLCGGRHYLSGKGGANYQSPGKFAQAGIDLFYTNFKPISYSQRGAEEFVPGLSVIDALFNVGGDSIAGMFAALRPGLSDKA